MSYDFCPGMYLPIDETVCEIHWKGFTDYCDDVTYDYSKEFGLHRFSSISECHQFIQETWGLQDLPTPDDQFDWLVEFEGQSTSQSFQFWIDFNPKPHSLLDDDSEYFDCNSQEWREF